MFVMVVGRSHLDMNHASLSRRSIVKKMGGGEGMVGKATLLNIVFRRFFVGWIDLG